MHSDRPGFQRAVEEAVHSGATIEGALRCAAPGAVPAARERAGAQPLVPHAALLPACLQASSTLRHTASATCTAATRTSLPAGHRVKVARNITKLGST